MRWLVIRLDAIGPRDKIEGSTRGYTLQGITPSRRCSQEEEAREKAVVAQSFQVSCRVL